MLKKQGSENYFDLIHHEVCLTSFTLVRDGCGYYSINKKLWENIKQYKGQCIDPLFSPMKTKPVFVCSEKSQNLLQTLGANVSNFLATS